MGDLDLSLCYGAIRPKDQSLLLTVGQTITVKTSSDEQSSISRKGIIDVTQNTSQTFNIVGLKPGFVIFDPAPFSQNTARYLVTVVRKKVPKSKTAVSVANKSASLVEFLRSENVIASEVGSTVFINCLALEQSMIRELKKFFIPKLLSDVNTAKKSKSLKCQSQWIHLNISITEKSVDLETKLGARNTPFGIPSPQYNERTQKFETIATFSQRHSSQSVLLAKKNGYISKESYGNIEIMTKDLSARRTSPDEFELYLNLKIKFRKLEKSFHTKNIFKQQQPLTFDLFKYSGEQDSESESFSLSDIPILGILFKDSIERDKSSKHILTIEAVDFSL